MNSPLHAHSARWLRRAGILLPLALACTGMTALLQYFGPLPLPYTWMRPLQTLDIVLQRAYAPTWLAGGYALGWAARPTSRTWLHTKLRRDEQLALPAHAGWMLLGGAVFVLVDAALYRWHTTVDHLAVFFAGVRIVYLLTSGEGARSARLGRGALELAVTLSAFLLVSYVFTVLKAHLFLVAAPRDGVLLSWEQTLLGTPLHRSVVRWASGQPDFVVLCDRIYYRIFEHMGVVSLFLTGLGQTAVRQRYTSALCVCYLLGAISYYLVPSVGPAFAEPQAYQFMRELPLVTNEFQAFLLHNTRDVTRGELSLLTTYEFLAAMPSLHMAHEFVMLRYSRASTLFFALAAMFTGLTSVAVLVLGWHYALDVLGGLLLAGVSVWIAERVGDRWYPR